MTGDQAFLSDLVRRPLKFQKDHAIEPLGLFVGKGSNAFEIAVVRASSQVTPVDLVGAWKDRKASRAAPVLLVALSPSGADLCGATGEPPPVHTALDLGLVERLCREALNLPDRHAATRYLAQTLPSLETELPGIRNAGLLATHELLRGVPARKDWHAACAKAVRARNCRDVGLLKALKFTVKKLDNVTNLLKSGDKHTALAVLLLDTETPEMGTPRFTGLSPVSYALAKADAENLPWVLFVQGNRLRLYPSSVDMGVGRGGRTETYVDCTTDLLPDEQMAYLWLLFSAEALLPEGSLRQILNDSHRFAGDLAKRLRERIYDEVVPALAHGITSGRKKQGADPDELATIYEMVMTVLFRLLFIAYAEDRDLLPYRFSENYRRRSLKQKAQELATNISEGKPIASGVSHWKEVSSLCEAVAIGNSEWAVTPYGGELFATGERAPKANRELEKIDVQNEHFEGALRGLLVTRTEDGFVGPVDFRALGLREFGTIYEGLLESELAIANTDLTQNKDGDLVPAKKGGKVTMPSGTIYLHNRSGIRKSSGSYYTPHFAVEHLLRETLSPALDDHFRRLDKIEDDTDAADAFFDFRIADIAMGSGHFLVAAIDCVERKMTDYLAKRDLPGVHQNLGELRDVSSTELSKFPDAVTVEDNQLLRRLIARKCIYGVDLNALSVQLTKLAIWIHSFVPGLPLSMLDHNLVHGNSLVGIDTIQTIHDKLKEAEAPLLGDAGEKLFGKAKAPLRRLANINDATLKDVDDAQMVRAEIKDSLQDTSDLCTLITAGDISSDRAVTRFSLKKWEQEKNDPEFRKTLRAAKDELADLDVVDFPVAFPEVFLRDRPGFDVILGNPPWEKAKVEEHAFWARYFPGLRSKTQPDQEALKKKLESERPDLLIRYQSERAKNDRLRRVLVGGRYPGMGTGDPDLYKAFCWRFWNLTTTKGGRIGVVLPRGTFTDDGSKSFRETVFGGSTRINITSLRNSAGWIFPRIHKQYTVALVCLTRGVPSPNSLQLRGPYSSRDAYNRKISQDFCALDPREVSTWSDTSSLPMLPAEESVEVFSQMRKAPRLDREDQQWKVRPYCEMHATQQKDLMTFTENNCRKLYWPVYKGESFDLWNPDTGIYYGYANSLSAAQWIHQRRNRGRMNPSSPHREFDLTYITNEGTLPCYFPRIAFRDITNSIDARTVRVALVPPNVFLTHLAPYFLWPKGDERDQAFLLGVLSSFPLDWYARRFVTLHLTFSIVNQLPVPRPPKESSLRRRVVELAGRLACQDDRYSTWASAINVDSGSIATHKKNDMLHEIDAVVAHLYGLSERQIVHVFETYRENHDYQDRLCSVLRHYQTWSGRQ